MGGLPIDRPAIESRHALKSAHHSQARRLTSALDSTSANTSQYAANHRTAGDIFVVRFSGEWHYPCFQFDRLGMPIENFPEVNPILAGLSPGCMTGIVWVLATA
jgi:hypothetical protein